MITYLYYHHLCVPTFAPATCELLIYHLPVRARRPPAGSHTRLLHGVLTICHSYWGPARLTTSSRLGHSRCQYNAEYMTAHDVMQLVNAAENFWLASSHHDRPTKLTRLYELHLDDQQSIPTCTPARRSCMRRQCR